MSCRPFSLVMWFPLSFVFDASPLDVGYLVKLERVEEIETVDERPYEFLLHNDQQDRTQLPRMDRCMLVQEQSTTE